MFFRFALDFFSLTERSGGELKKSTSEEKIKKKIY